ncbi:hypothetical protein BGZ50_009685 [Haplosporangium sp. Z 11]|nr:hypothetical protein BGZ50_009685 [Haplosporangium sp. Z 11]
MGCTSKTFKSDIPKSVEALSDILQNSTLNTDAIERERDVILREQQKVDKMMEEVVFGHPHATAFQVMLKQMVDVLGRTILRPKKNIKSLTCDDLTNYIKTNYTADRMVLVGAGGVDHDTLVKLTENHFSKLPVSVNST